MSVHVEQHGAAVVLRVTGELDLLTAPRLEESVDNALREQPQVLILDLSEVGFLASSGIAALVDAHQRGGKETEVRVVARGNATFRPLELTGVTAKLAVHPTLDEALSVE
jgi:anti-sigma B factor antagonist